MRFQAFSGFSLKYEHADKGNSSAFSTLSGHEMAFSNFEFQKFHGRACPRPGLLPRAAGLIRNWSRFAPSKNNPGGATVQADIVEPFKSLYNLYTVHKN